MRRPPRRRARREFRRCGRRAAHPIAQPTTSGTFSGNVALIGEVSIVDPAQGSLLYLMCGVAMNAHGGMTFHDADYIQLEPCVARRPN